MLKEEYIIFVRQNASWLRDNYTKNERPKLEKKGKHYDFRAIQPLNEEAKLFCMCCGEEFELYNNENKCPYCELEINPGRIK